MLGYAALPKLLEAEAVRLHILDRVDAAEVGHHKPILAKLGHGVSVRLDLVHRPAVDGIDRTWAEPGLEEVICTEAKFFELLDQLQWDVRARSLGSGGAIQAGVWGCVFMDHLHLCVAAPAGLRLLPRAYDSGVLERPSAVTILLEFSRTEPERPQVRCGETCTPRQAGSLYVTNDRHKRVDEVHASMSAGYA